MPDPADDKELYERKSLQMIKRYVERSDGRAFVLFTSYEMLNRRCRFGALAGRP